jgi:hypothetical protein
MNILVKLVARHALGLDGKSLRLLTGWARVSHVLSQVKDFGGRRTSIRGKLAYALSNTTSLNSALWRPSKTRNL